MFCLEHRSYKSHECPKSDHKSRKVVVCQTCSIAIEVTGKDGEDEKMILQRHEDSGRCDPTMRKKPVCPVKRCKEVLTFSNTTTCKTCHVKFCLRHRFPADHSCRKQTPAAEVAAGGGWNEKFLAAFGVRNCGKDGDRASKASSSKTATASPSVKAY